MARYGVVPFTGRESELADLDRWADDDEPIAVRLFTGQGGTGKTRLLTEWIKRRREEHTTVGFLRGAITNETIEMVTTADRATVVIDYAGTRKGLPKLVERLAELRTCGDKPCHIRVVLLARNAGEWWKALVEKSTEIGELLHDSEHFALESFTPDVDARGVEFDRAVKVFAKHLGTEVPRDHPDFEDEQFSRILYLHISALAAVYRDDPSEESFLDEILAHEKRFWTRKAGIDTATDEGRELLTQIQQSVAALTLRGSTKNENELVTMLENLRLSDVSKPIRLMRAVYPVDGCKGWIGFLEPDILGERLITNVLQDGATPSDFLTLVADGADESELINCFEVLGRIELIEHDDGRKWLKKLLFDNFEQNSLVAFQAALSLGEKSAHSCLGMMLAESFDSVGSVTIAHALDGKVPEKTVALRDVAVWIERTILSEVPEGEENLRDRAQRLNNYGNRLNALGRHEEALESTQESVEIRRKLAETQPDTFLPDLAKSLNGLGNRLNALGRREEALKATREAIDIRRKLAETQPDTFLPDLAASLNNLGSDFRNLDRHEEALEAAQESVDHYRNLARLNPDVYDPDLAMSLNNLGARFSALEHHEQALKATQESVDIRRKLAETRPDAYLPDLAKSLNNLGNRLNALGHREEALKATQEAVDIRKKLSQARPDAFLPFLARSLASLGDILDELERYDEAKKTSQEALDTLWPFFERYPRRFQKLIASMLRDNHDQLRGEEPPRELLDREAKFKKLTEQSRKSDA